MENLGEKINLVMGIRGDDHGHFLNEELNVKIEPANKDFNLKLLYNNDRIFDGWFYFTNLIRRFAKEQALISMKQMMKHQRESNKEAVEWLRSNV